MRKVEIAFNVYKYDELSEDVKAKVFEDAKEREYYDYINCCLIDDMREESNNLVREYFHCEHADDVYYDLSYCQGSGAMIEFTTNIEDLNNKYHILNDEQMRLITDKGMMYDIVVKHSDNHYCHEYTFRINYEDDFGYWDYEDIKDDYNLTEDEFNEMQDKVYALLDDFNKHNTSSKFVEDIIEMNKEFTKIGYNIVEHPVDDDWIMERINDYEYTEDGCIY